MYLTYYWNSWLAHFLMYLELAMQVHHAEVSITPSSKQVHELIQLITEASLSAPHSLSNVHGF